MATASVLEQKNRLALDQSRRTPSTNSSLADQAPQNSPNRGAALRMAQSLATGQRNKNASLDRQVVGEVGARAGQAVGAYVGGVGAFVGKRLGRVAGEQWRIVLAVTLIWIVLPYLLLIIGFALISTTILRFFF